MALILGIESSCDESAAAVTEGPHEVLASIVATQDELHQPYAGVVPEIASRAHLQRVPMVVDQALQQAGCTLQDLDAIAVGHAPGLIGSLLVGVSAAKTLAWSIDRPLLGVHHLLAHVHAPALNDVPIEFPAIGLLASGGHTAILSQTDPLHANRLGRTIDDAVGEAFDKAAITLGLGWPGGPAVEKLAADGDPSAVKLPIASLDGPDLNCSFSGLKTALLYATRGQPEGRGRHATFPRTAEDLTHQARADLAASFQHAAIEALIRALDQACVRVNARSLVGGGGVLANTLLRQRLEELADRHDVTLRLPPQRFCIDNAAMIAGLGAHMLAAGRTSGLDLQALARMPVEAKS